jgi:hypothetical protein
MLHDVREWAFSDLVADLGVDETQGCGQGLVTSFRIKLSSLSASEIRGTIARVARVTGIPVSREQGVVGVRHARPMLVVLEFIKLCKFNKSVN